MTTRTVRIAFRLCVGAAILSPLGVTRPCLGQGGALGALRERYPGVKVYEAGGRVRTVYGRAMTAGATPREAAQAWLGEHGAVFGTWPDLEEFRESRLRNAPPGTERRALMYRQNMDGLPVVGSSFRVMTRGEPGGGPARVVYVAGRIAIRPQGGLPAPTVTPREALAAAQAHPAGRALTAWSDPELVAIYDDAPKGNAVAYPAWRASGAGQNPLGDAYTFYVHAVTGVVARHHSSVIHAFDPVQGTVTGNATPTLIDPERLGPATINLPSWQNCHNDAAEFALRDTWVIARDSDGKQIDAAFTDELGAYTLDIPPSYEEVDMFAELRGPAWIVLDGRDWWNHYGKEFDPLKFTGNPVAPPATGVDLLFNPAPTGEMWTAAVNAHKQMSRIWRWLGLEATEIPEAPVAVYAVQNECGGGFIPYSGPCPIGPCPQPIWTQGVIRFGRSRTQAPLCPNPTYSTIIAHEYAHFVLYNLVGITAEDDAAAFHEGFADSTALLVYDAEFWAQDFWGCGEHSRWPREPGVHHVYPMCADTAACATPGKPPTITSHCIGELLSALWLDMCDVLGPVATRQLFLDWMLIAQVPLTALCNSGQLMQSAGPNTLIEILAVVDDSMHVPTICAIFQNRNIEDPVACQESAGWSCYGDCDSNGVLDIFDFLCFQNAFVAGDPYADCDRDGQWTLFDFVCFQSEFVAGCP